VRFLRKTAVLRFSAPSGDLGTTYDNHLKLVGKCVVDFLLVLIELFSLSVALKRYKRISAENRRFRSLQCGQFDPTFQVEGVAPANHSFSQKTRLNGLSYGIKIWTDFSSVLSQSTRLTDRQTDRHTDERTPFSRSPCIQCIAVKTVEEFHNSCSTFTETFPFYLYLCTGRLF